MKHTTKLLLTMVVTLVTVIGLCGCPSPVNDYADTHEHIWELVEEVKPTCTTKGTKTYKCKLCEETKVEEVSALGHTWSVVEDTECKCIKHYTCTVCGETKTETHHHEDYETSGYCEICGKYKYENGVKLNIRIYNSVEDWTNSEHPSKNTNNNSTENNLYKECHYSFMSNNVPTDLNSLLHLKSEYTNYIVGWYNRGTEYSNKKPYDLEEFVDIEKLTFLILKPITE